MDFDFTMRVGEETYIIPIHVEYVSLDPESLPSGEVEVRVLEAVSGKPISGAHVIVSLPSGLMVVEAYTGPNGFVRLPLPDTNYLKELYEDYNLTVSFNGYFIEVSKPGYREAYFQGIETGSVVEVRLEPKEVVYEYVKVAEYQQGYGVWWIKAPQDCSFLATSPGIHDHLELPEEAGIYVFSPEGNVLASLPI